VKEIVCEASSRMIDPIWPGYRVTRTAKQPPAAEDPPPQLLFHAPPSSRSPLLLCRDGGSGPEEAIPGGRIGRVLEARMRGRWRRGERSVKILWSQSSSSTKIEARMRGRRRRGERMVRILRSQSSSSTKIEGCKGNGVGDG
jgi:hypothetical protein